MELNDLKFEYIEEFIDNAIKRIEDDEDCFISIFSKYGQACDIIKKLLSYDLVKLDNITLCDEQFDGYSDEYIIEIWSIDGITYVGCEPAKRNGKYFNYEGNVCYLLEDCNSRILKTCNYDEMYDVIIGEDKCECECNCGCDECCALDENDIYGFSINKETDYGHSKFTYYSSIPLSKSKIYEIFKKFEF